MLKVDQIKNKMKKSQDWSVIYTLSTIYYKIIVIKKNYCMIAFEILMYN